MQRPILDSRGYSINKLQNPSLKGKGEMRWQVTCTTHLSREASKAKTSADQTRPAKF
jgi:hypothetical protein